MSLLYQISAVLYFIVDHVILSRSAKVRRPRTNSLREFVRGPAFAGLGVPLRDWLVWGKMPEAIYSLHCDIFSRSDGDAGPVVKAAYRAGEKFADEFGQADDLPAEG